MRSLLADIETNGDSLKLWLTENCVFEDGAFESTAALYEDYRVWCEQNGVFCAGRPKMRDVIMTNRPSVVATRRRIVDAETGEVKLVWGPVGVRLRIPDDDLDEDPAPTDPVGPGQATAPGSHEPHHDAICDGDPVDSRKDSEGARDIASPDECVESVFLPKDRITGSARHCMADPVPIEHDTGRSLVSLEMPESFSELSAHGDVPERGGSGCT